MGRSCGDSFGGAYGFAVDGCRGSLPPAAAPPPDDPSFISDLSPSRNSLSGDPKQKIEEGL